MWLLLAIQSLGWGATFRGSGAIESASKVCRLMRGDRVMKVGFIGLGNMGSGMAANLLKAEHEVTVYNRTPSKAQALVERGALRRSGGRRLPWRSRDHDAVR